MAVTLPPVPGLIKVVWTHTCSGRTFTNHAYLYAAGSGYTSAELATLAQSLYTVWEADGPFQLMDSVVSLTQCECIDLTDDMGRVGYYVHTTAGPASGTKPLPLSVRLCLPLKIARRYRGGRPRMYIAGQDQGSQANEVSWSTSYISGLTSLLNTFWTEMNGQAVGGTSLVWVNVSYYSDKALRATPVIDDILVVEAQQRVCSQRRSLGKTVPDIPE